MGIDWKTFDEMEQFISHSTKSSPPQLICVRADVETLRSELPTPCHAVQPDEGPPAPLDQWFGHVNDRFIVLELEQLNRSDTAAVYTCYPHAEEWDWTSLLELVDVVPSALRMRRTMYVDSRNAGASCQVVYRPQPGGWNMPIYRAECLVDANEFVRFLLQDEFNGGCFVAEPEPIGKWAVVRAGEPILGSSPALSSALECACSLTEGKGCSVTVKDLSGMNEVTYLVTDGKVVAE